ncbi:hypothetical protein [Desulfoluna spongiiphila]|uniref:Uncharacterized protein n=1 Tax=Desulfoluna spongiiphila TaxID=419481 RepID=A0A1G5ADJ9_9BACT|nr:hypothetical protein [Desulfoluna spongiiphila]SCX75983.1 hypothetical protein SAMN05216233_10182 [Desulfoluna spongiiphila]
MNQTPEHNYLFITPYLEEVKRITKACPSLSFKEPTAKPGRFNKSDSLKALIMDGHNIASTHALFSLMDAETLDLLTKSDYHLILDEVMDVVHQVPITKGDLSDLFRLHLDADPETHRVSVKQDVPLDYDGKYAEIVGLARDNRLVYIDGKILVWELPREIFGAFKSTHILTYMFDGQIQKAYFDLHDVGYQYRTVRCRTPDAPHSDPTKYELVDLYDGYDEDFRRRLGDLLTIHVDNGTKLNAVGHGRTSLSLSWYHNKRNGPLKAQLRRNLSNYFRKKHKATADTILWTTFKDQTDSLKGKGYAGAFEVCNVRATNQYRDRTILAYCINRYVNTPVQRYLKARGAGTVDEDRYALSELIQWIMRSALREDMPVDLYLPSRRMRGLLTAFMGVTER